MTTQVIETEEEKIKRLKETYGLAIVPIVPSERKKYTKEPKYVSVKHAEQEDGSYYIIPIIPNEVFYCSFCFKQLEQKGTSLNGNVHRYKLPENPEFGYQIAYGCDMKHLIGYMVASVRTNMVSTIAKVPTLYAIAMTAVIQNMFENGKKSYKELGIELPIPVNEELEKLCMIRRGPDPTEQQETQSKI